MVYFWVDDEYLKVFENCVRQIFMFLGFMMFIKIVNKWNIVFIGLMIYFREVIVYM